MALYGDYHTHTVYSHGKGTVRDNVEAAVAAGLKAVAVTDHGFRHMLYSVHRGEYRDQKRDVEEMRLAHPEIEILQGLETNLQGHDGRIDIKDSDVENLDVIIMGYHRMVVAPGPVSFFDFWLPSMLNSGRDRVSVRRRVRNTDAFIHAINRYPIDIISHPKYKIDVDVVAIAKEAARLGTLMELNGKKISMTDEEIKAVLDTGVGLIADSDAHSPDRVGEISVPMTVIERIGIPSDRIVNFDRKPVFRSALFNAARKAETAASRTSE